MGNGLKAEWVKDLKVLDRNFNKTERHPGT